MTENDSENTSPAPYQEGQTSPPSTASPVKPEAKQSATEDEPESVLAQELTPEEQMAQFEESLKESDWGHQPC